MFEKQDGQRFGREQVFSSRQRISMASMETLEQRQMLSGVVTGYVGWENVPGVTTAYKILYMGNRDFAELGPLADCAQNPYELEVIAGGENDTAPFNPNVPSATDADTEYQIDWEDGSTSSSVSNPEDFHIAFYHGQEYVSAFHAYAEPGQHHAVVTVMETGNRQASLGMYLTVPETETQNRETEESTGNLVIDTENTNANVQFGETVQIAASDECATTVEYFCNTSVDWGDGTFSSPINAEVDPCYSGGHFWAGHDYDLPNCLYCAFMSVMEDDACIAGLTFCICVGIDNLTIDGLTAVSATSFDIGPGDYVTIQAFDNEASTYYCSTFYIDWGDGSCSYFGDPNISSGVAWSVRAFSAWHQYSTTNGTYTAHMCIEEDDETCVEVNFVVNVDYTPPPPGGGGSSPPVVTTPPPWGTGLSGPGWTASNTVRYADGILRVQTPAGIISSPTTSLPSFSFLGAGMVPTWDWLQEDGDCCHIIVYRQGVKLGEFDWDDECDCYTLRGYPSEEHVRLDPSGVAYVLTEDGTSTIFYGFGASGSLPGQFYMRTDANGCSTYVLDASDGRINSIYNDNPDQHALYSYDTNDRVCAVEVDAFNGIEYCAISHTVFTYYSSGTAPGKLESIEFRNGSNQCLGTCFYWYDTHGCLEYIVGPSGYARLCQDHPNPANWSDSVVGPYASLSYSISCDSGRVTATSSAGGAAATYSYAATSTFADGFNSWKYKTVESLPGADQNTVYSNFAGQVMLNIFYDHTSGSYSGTFYRYADDNYAGNSGGAGNGKNAGHLIWIAEPSAVCLTPSNVGAIDQSSDLMDLQSGDYQYLWDDRGVIHVTDYYICTGSSVSGSVCGAVAGLEQDTKLMHGDLDSSPLWQTCTQYYMVTDTNTGQSIYPVGTQTVYRDDYHTCAQTTTYDYGWDDVHMQWMKTIKPVISTGQNGPGTGHCDVECVYYNSQGQQQWTMDGDGFINYYAYDAGSGTLCMSIVDVDYSQLGSTEQGYFDITGWPEPDGRLHLVSTYDVDSQGRTIVSVDPNTTNTTYAAYNDDVHEVRVYPGWHYDAGWTTTGPISVTRDDPGRGYSETFTFSGTPALNSALPAGTERYAVRIQSMTRADKSGGGSTVTVNVCTDVSEPYHTFAVGDLVVINGVTNEAAYNGTFAVESVTSTSFTYSISTRPASPTGTAEIASYPIRSLSRTYTNLAGQVTCIDAYFNLSSLAYTPDAMGTKDVNFYRTRYAYDDEGNQNGVLGPTGTISRTVHDGQGRVTQTWVGTNDSAATGQPCWTTRFSTSGSSNMLLVSENQYDNNLAGDGNLTKVMQHVDTNAAHDRVTLNWYDWRDRLVASKSGAALDTNGHQAPGSEDTGTNRPLIKYDLDNLGEVTGTYLYDGDGVCVNAIPEAGGTATGGVPTFSATLIAQTTSDFDDQGRIYAKHTFSVTGGTASAGPTASTWYDHRGNVMKTKAPGGLVTKNQYDGAGRLTARFSTDGDGDGATSWDDASNLTGDTVLSQQEYVYDANGNVIFTIDRQRFDSTTYPENASRTGALGDSSSSSLAKARVSYTESFYDVLGRLTASVDLGTNCGTPLIGRPEGDDPSATPDARSNARLMTTYCYDQYDAAQRSIVDVMDPNGIITRSILDALGHTVLTFDDYYGSGTSHLNRVTNYGYDGNGDLVCMHAVLVGSGYQETDYVYVVSQSGGIHSNDILATIKYPRKTAGDGQSAGDASNQTCEQVNFTYNALGQPITKADQNGNTHCYTYDVLGRLVADDVGTGTLSGSIDGTVRKLCYTYNTAGQLVTATSYCYDYVNCCYVPLNQVKDEYNGLGQLCAEYQCHSGEANGSTLAVRYSYDQSCTGRIESMTYPNGRVLHFGYDGSTLDNCISRLSYLADNDGGSPCATHLEDYTYLGLSTVVQRSHPESGVNLTYINTGAGGDGDACDAYDGLDLFGRVMDQHWVLDSTPTDDFGYAYDRNSNPTSKSNGLCCAYSETYCYDNLNRLIDANRNGSDLQCWSLNELGDWSSFCSTSGQQDRCFNAQNQITCITGQTTPCYDSDGNMTRDEAGTLYTYDAWNRLTKTNKSGTCQTFAYDAVGRRIGETANSNTTDLYYSSRWQVIEERGQFTTQYVWSPVYVDALVLRDADADNNASSGNRGNLTTGCSGLEQRIYVQQDANWNVTALVGCIGSTWQPIERYVYDPYGALRVRASNWTEKVAGSEYSWRYLYKGDRLDGVPGHTDAGAGNYISRKRDYRPTLGTWAEQDSAGYVDGWNLYLSYDDSPTARNDPYGTVTVTSGGCTFTDYGPRDVASLDHPPKYPEQCWTYAGTEVLQDAWQYFSTDSANGWGFDGVYSAAVSSSQESSNIVKMGGEVKGTYKVTWGNSSASSSFSFSTSASHTGKESWSVGFSKQYTVQVYKVKVKEWIKAIEYIYAPTGTPYPTGWTLAERKTTPNPNWKPIGPGGSPPPMSIDVLKSPMFSWFTGRETYAYVPGLSLFRIAEDSAGQTSTDRSSIFGFMYSDMQDAVESQVRVQT